jgi:hypothetical protein
LTILPFGTGHKRLSRACAAHGVPASASLTVVSMIFWIPTLLEEASRSIRRAVFDGLYLEPFGRPPRFLGGRSQLSFVIKKLLVDKNVVFAIACS